MKTPKLPTQDLIRLDATTGANPPSPLVACIRWSFVAVFINGLITLASLYGTFLFGNLIGTLVMVRMTGDDRATLEHVPAWIQYSTFLLIFGLYSAYLIWYIRKHLRDVPNETTSRNLQYDLLHTVIAALPDTAQWHIRHPTSRYETNTAGEELRGTPTNPEQPLDSVGGWSAYQPLTDEIPTEREGIFLRFARRKGILSLRLKVWIPKTRTEVLLPKLNLTSPSTEHFSNERAHCAILVWEDHDGVLDGIAQPTTHQAHKDAKALLFRWSRELADALSTTLQHPEDLPWGTPQNAAYPHTNPLPSRPPQHGVASRRCDLTSPQSNDYNTHWKTRQRRAQTLLWIDRLGSLGVVLSGIWISSTISAPFLNAAGLWTLPVLYQAHMGVTALQSVLVSLRTKAAAKRHTAWTPQGYLGDVFEEEILRLDGSLLTMGSHTIDLSKPFSMHQTRSAARHNTDPLLGITVAQDQHHIAFCVPVEHPSSLSSLETLNLNAPTIDGHDFDTWIFPTLSWYAHVHGETAPHIAYTHAKTTKPDRV